MTTDELLIKENTDLKGSWEVINVLCPFCSTDEHVYIYEDQKTAYCLACATEFDASDLELVTESEYEDVMEIPTTHDKREIPEVKQAPIGYTYWKCVHQPFEVLSGEGWSINGGTKETCRSSVDSYDVIMNLTGITMKERHEIPIPELKKWADYHQKFTEVLLDWPDYGEVSLPFGFWQDMYKYITENKKRLLVVCTGGHGRTGTALACLLVMSGLNAKDAVEWLRTNYCKDAVETTVQFKYIEYIERAKFAYEKTKLPTS